MGCTQSKATDVKQNKPSEPQKTQTQPTVERVKSPPKKISKSLIPESSESSTSFRNQTKLPLKTDDANKVRLERHISEGVVSDANLEKACFGAGCYWGTEKFFKYNFSKKFPELGAIVNGTVGFMGPKDAPANPTYREVCSGATGHVEVFQFEYSGGDEYYEQIVRFFFQFHDPTTPDRQGNDKGTQYASVIYCYTEKQLKIATQVKEELQNLLDERRLRCYKDNTVTTDIRMHSIFYPAHDEHQDYLAVNPNGYCNHKIRFEDWPSMTNFYPK